MVKSQQFNKIELWAGGIMNNVKFRMTWIVLAISIAFSGCGSKYASFKSSSSGTELGDVPGPTPPAGGVPIPVPTPGGGTTPVRQSPMPGQWVNVTSNLSGMASECGNMTYVSAKPSEDLMIAGVAARGLFGSRDGGSTWSALGTMNPTAQIVNRPGNIVYDPVNTNVFWEAGIYNSNGVYRTNNNGLSFTALGNASLVSHSDSVSVDFTDPNRQTLLAGGHEMSEKLLRSQDGGQTWTNIFSNLPAGSAFPSFPLVVNSQTFFLGSAKSWSSGNAGIYQSNNAGLTWTRVSKGGEAEPLVARDGSIYWPANDGAMMRGTGSGANWTWTEVTAPGQLRNDVHPIELPDGRIVTLGGQNIMISSNRGASWQAFGPQLPFRSVGISYSNFDKSFFIWQFDCGNSVLPNAIMKLWM